MAASWTIAPSRHDPASPELLELPDSENALAAFPSERGPEAGLRRDAHRRRQTGVTMRVTRLSAGLVLGLATILLAGAVAVAVIGIFAVREDPRPLGAQIAQQGPG
jgi:hypothetical protein